MLMALCMLHLMNNYPYRKTAPYNWLSLCRNIFHNPVKITTCTHMCYRCMVIFNTSGCSNLLCLRFLCESFSGFKTGVALEISFFIYCYNHIVLHSYIVPKEVYYVKIIKLITAMKLFTISAACICIMGSFRNNISKE